MKMHKRMFCLGAAAVMLFSLTAMTSCDPFFRYRDDNHPSHDPYHFLELPLESHYELSWWYDYSDIYCTDDFTRLEEHPFMKELDHRSNVSFKFVRPTDPGRAAEELNTQIASGCMCDLVTHNGYLPYYDGNTYETLADWEIYLCLNDYVDAQMANFNALRQEYVVIDRYLVTAQGNILWIPCLNNIDRTTPLKQTNGMVVRKDLLDEIQFVSEDGVSPYPVTVSDWERMLTEFSLLGVKRPLAAPRAAGDDYVLPDDIFLSAWGVRSDCYLDPETGAVVCGAGSDGYRAYLTLLNGWYRKGLISDEPLTRSNRLAAREVGAWYGSADEVADLARQSNETDYALIGVPDPVLNVGDKIVMRDFRSPIGSAERDSVFVSYYCENGPVACRVLDEFFTQGSYIRTSYGIEGEDYTLDGEGAAVFSDKITNSPLGMRAALYQNAFPASLWRDPDLLLNYAYDKNTLDAIARWSESSCEYALPDFSFLPYDAEELGQNYLDEVRSAVNAGSAALLTAEEAPDDDAWNYYAATVREAGLWEYTDVMRFLWEQYAAARFPDETE